ncbi:peptidase S1 [Shewanella sp. OPT22]|nr:peptidase S1 [Shewanella sp. OPT22]
MKWILLSLSVISLNVRAIVIRDDVADKKYLADSNDFKALATFYIDGAHGTLIKPNWVLTAAHTTFCLQEGSNISINDQLIPIEQVYIHNDYQPGISHDIALLKLSRPIIEVEPATVYSKNDEQGKSVWFIGVGGTGNGLTGQTVDNYDNAGVLRKAQNVVESVDNALIKFKFDSGVNALSLEGVSGSGDSGSPAYFTEDNKTYIIGISSRVEGGNIGKYGITEVYSRVSFFEPWIKSVINSDEASRKNVSIEKLKGLPAGLTPQNLKMVCDDIGLTKTSKQSRAKI